MSDEAVHPFRVEVPEEVLVDLRDRLGRTRWPDQPVGEPWALGTDLTYLRELCEHWRTTFDWRAQEVRLNRWPHVVTRIDGQQVHAIHARSDRPDALPLVLTHGWPGSVVEFLEVIEPLRQDFHVVVPSLPGYGWSGPTTETGWGPRRIAQAWLTLMTRLGYERFGVQGGDWGAMVSAQVAALAPDRVVGHHSNMLVAFPPDASGLEVTPEEQADQRATATFLAKGAAYQEIQGKNPQTLAYGLLDSPAGLAGWIVEKFHAWTDHDGDLETAVSRDDLLANLTTYWVTATAGSAARLYGELGSALPDGFVDVPTAVALAPREVVRTPRSWAAACFDVVRWNRLERGGHFLALEEPDLYVQEVASFFRPLTPGAAGR